MVQEMSKQKNIGLPRQKTKKLLCYVMTSNHERATYLEEKIKQKSMIIKKIKHITNFIRFLLVNLK